MKVSHLLLLLASILIWLHTAQAVEPESPPQPEVTTEEIQNLIGNKEIRLSLSACLQLALKNNLEIAIQRGRS